MVRARRPRRRESPRALGTNKGIETHGAGFADLMRKSIREVSTGVPKPGAPASIVASSTEQSSVVAAAKSGTDDYDLLSIRKVPSLDEDRKAASVLVSRRIARLLE